jgi:hypothetical protein
MRREPGSEVTRMVRLKFETLLDPCRIHFTDAEGTPLELETYWPTLIVSSAAS